MTDAIITATTHEAAALAALAARTGDTPPADGFTGSIGPEDFKLPRRIFNQKKGQDAAGARLQPDMFFDPISKVTCRKINAILLHSHTTRAWTTYNNDEEETNYICTSEDCITGTMQATGATRRCLGCPDAQWRAVGKKRVLNCSKSHHVLAVDLLSQEPFVITFRRTSESVIVNHVQSHHHAKAVIQGRKANMPLHWRHVELSLALAENGNYAVPVIRPTGVSTPAEVDACEATLDAYRSIITRAATADVPAAGGGADTSFNTEQWDREA
jgi:hypothetical protein